MICDLCQLAPAAIHIQELSGGKQRALHLCQACAVRKQQGLKALDQFSLSDFLRGLTDMVLDEDELAANGLDEVPVPRVCEHCGWTLSAYREEGRLGCGRCYETFAEALKDDLAAYHRGATAHRGGGQSAVFGGFPEAAQPVSRENGRTSPAQREDRLRRELQDALSEENYERAAELRDCLVVLADEAGHG